MVPYGGSFFLRDPGHDPLARPLLPLLGFAFLKLARDRFADESGAILAVAQDSADAGERPAREARGHVIEPAAARTGHVGYDG
jgi:hypothetical protein